MKPVRLHGGKGLGRFLKTQRMAPETLAALVGERLSALRDRPEKLKPVAGLRYEGDLVLEFRLSAGRDNYRIAYVERPQEILVLYATTTLLKKDFLREISRYRF